MSKELLEEAMERVFETLSESANPAIDTHQKHIWKLQKIQETQGKRDHIAREKCQYLIDEHKKHIKKLRSGEASGTNRRLNSSTKDFVESLKGFGGLASLVRAGRPS